MRNRQVLLSLFSAYEIIRSKRILGGFTSFNLWKRLGFEGLCKGDRKNSCYVATFLLLLYGILIYGYRFSSPQEALFISHVNAADILAKHSSNSTCDIFNGRWIYDKAYPLYRASRCPFAESGFRCQSNGRRDTDYMKWRWQPHGCDLPRFNALEILKRLNGSRVVFVGDSMGRTQWESLICLLMQGVDDRKSVYEVNGNKITKRIPYLGVRFSSFNLMVEYYRSPFIVQRGLPPRRVPKRVHSALKLDKPDPAYKRLHEADIMVFNTGHWWTAAKTFETGCYFQVGDSLKLGMRIVDAFEKALDTWASWVQKKINTSRTHVYFRSFETSHWQGSFSGGVCKVTKRPIRNAGKLAKHPFSQILYKVLSRKNVGIAMLNITGLSAFRSDAHIGKWGDIPSSPDCSHWCLPGVPDVWNELLFASLSMKREGAWNKG